MRTTDQQSQKHPTKMILESLSQRLGRIFFKNGKAPGPDEFISEIIQALDSFRIEKLTELYNEIYKCGHLPDYFFDSFFISITLPQKTKDKECSNFKTISLMSHHLKIFLTIILGRMKVEKKVEPRERKRAIWIPSQQRNKGRNFLFQHFGPKTIGSAKRPVCLL